MTQSEASQLVGSEQLARLLETAAVSTRKRSHLLLHADQQDQVQRLLIGIEPESYVRPHVHSQQWEMIVLLRGRFDFLIFNPQAELVQRLAMSVASPVAQIPRAPRGLDRPPSSSPWMSRFAPCRCPRPSRHFVPGSCLGKRSQPVVDSGTT